MVRFCLRYKPSHRDLVEIMAERGLAFSHTILRRVQRFIPASSARLWRLLVLNLTALTLVFAAQLHPPLGRGPVSSKNSTQP